MAFFLRGWLTAIALTVFFCFAAFHAKAVENPTFKEGEVYTFCHDAKAHQEVLAAIRAEDYIKAKAVVLLNFRMGRCVYLPKGERFMAENVTERLGDGYILEGRILDWDNGPVVYVLIDDDMADEFIVPDEKV